MQHKTTSSLEKFGQFVSHQRLKNGWTQLELAMKVFNSSHYEFVGRLDLGKLAGVTLYYR